jgi:hypothetical protein
MAGHGFLGNGEVEMALHESCEFKGLFSLIMELLTCAKMGKCIRMLGDHAEINDNSAE